LLEHWSLSDFVNSRSLGFLKIWRTRECLLVLACWNKSELKSMGLLLETKYHFGSLHSPGGWWKSQSATNKQTHEARALVWSDFFLHIETSAKIDCPWTRWKYIRLHWVGSEWAYQREETNVSLL
jgi:hypothetical protein